MPSSLLAICAAHSHVIPTEGYTALASPDERLRTIVQLQQKAQALEAEIAERKKLEKALRQREEELTDFLENAVEGLHKIGPDGIILWANTAQMQLLGYTAEEYIGHHIAEFHVRRDLFDAIWAKLLRGESLHDYPEISGVKTAPSNTCSSTPTSSGRMGSLSIHGASYATSPCVHRSDSCKSACRHR